jgi:hypothetical protein
MRALSRGTAPAILLFSLGASMAVAQNVTEAAALDGRWDASLTSNASVIPFRLDIAGSGSTLKWYLL